MSPMITIDKELKLHFIYSSAYLWQKNFHTLIGLLWVVTQRPQAISWNHLPDHQSWLQYLPQENIGSSYYSPAGKWAWKSYKFKDHVALYWCTGVSAYSWPHEREDIWKMESDIPSPNWLQGISSLLLFIFSC